MDIGNTDRRHWLKLAAGAGAIALAPAQALARSAPRDVGRKFYPDGRVHPFRGNTIICHLPQQGPASEPFEALLDIYRQIPSRKFSRKVTLLPPSSYHMTIFGGANDPERKPGAWPASVPLDTPIDECTRILGERIKGAKIGDVAPIRMRVDTSPPSDSENPLTIRLMAVDAVEDARLRALRNRLSELFEIRSASHDRYRFHITLAYLIQHLDAGEQREFRAAYTEMHSELARRCPIIELGQPEYCSLDDMFHFKRLFYI